MEIDFKGYAGKDNGLNWCLTDIAYAIKHNKLDDLKWYLNNTYKPENATKVDMPPFFFVPEDINYFAYCVAVIDNNQEAIKMIMDHEDFDPTRTWHDFNAVTFALMYNNDEKTLKQIFMHEKIDLNAVCDEKWQHASPILVYVLSPNTDNDTFYAYMDAYKERYGKEALKDHINLKDDDGFSLILASIRCVDDEILKWLLNNGADPNACDNKHRTALMGAAANLKIEATKMLLVAGANPTLMDDEGRKAEDFLKDPEFDPNAEKIEMMLWNSECDMVDLMMQAQGLDLDEDIRDLGIDSLGHEDDETADDEYDPIDEETPHEYNENADKIDK